MFRSYFVFFSVYRAKRDLHLLTHSVPPRRSSSLSRGPHMATTVRRKDRIAGIWINHDTMIFSDVPAFFHVAATGELAEEPMRLLLERYRLGRDVLAARPDETGADGARVAAFREALIRNQQANSEERRVGKEGASTWSSRWAPFH